MTKKTIINRLILSCCCLGLTAWMATPLVLGQSINETGNPTVQELQAQSAGQWWVSNPEPKISFSPIVKFSDQTVIPTTGSMLVRNRDNVYATINTAGLIPGTAVTFWWVFFNNPHNCATRPCTPADLSNPAVQGSVATGGGKIIGADGTATFGAFRAAGDTTGVYTGLGTVQSLLNPLRAEIHFVMRSHGPAILADPVLLGQQLSLFNGGCPPNACVNLQASIHQP